MKTKSKIWLGIAVVVVVVGAVAYWPFDFYVHDVFCKSGEEDCIRQWLSAMGGWTTIPAAALGVWYVSKQIKNADRHHRETADIQLRRVRALAKRALSDVSELQSMAATYQFSWEQLSDIARHGEATREFISNVSDLQKRLENSVFDEMEREIFAAKVGVAKLRRHISDHATTFDRTEDGNILTKHVSELKARMAKVCEAINDYSNDLSAESKRFMTVTDRLIRPATA